MNDNAASTDGKAKPLEEDHSSCGHDSKNEVAREPNAETVAALLETKRIEKASAAKGYDDLDELFADLRE